MIDWKRVRELHDEIGNEEFLEIFELFVAEVEEVLARLPAVRDPAMLEADLHFVKGCALNLGFDELGQLCSEGERRALQGGVSPDDVARVIAAFDASKRCFQHEAQAALGA